MFLSFPGLSFIIGEIFVVSSCFGTRHEFGVSGPNEGRRDKTRESRGANRNTADPTPPDFQNRMLTKRWGREDRASSSRYFGSPAAPRPVPLAASRPIPCARTSLSEPAAPPTPWSPLPSPAARRPVSRGARGPAPEEPRPSPPGARAELEAPPLGAPLRRGVPPSPRRLLRERPPPSPGPMAQLPRQ